MLWPLLRKKKNKTTPTTFFHILPHETFVLENSSMASTRFVTDLVRFTAAGSLGLLTGGYINNKLYDKYHPLGPSTAQQQYLINSAVVLLVPSLVLAFASQTDMLDQSAMFVGFYLLPLQNEAFHSINEWMGAWFS